MFEKKLISIVIPAHNEELVIDELAKQLQKAMGQMADYSFEVVVVENGSTDSTFEKLLAVRERDKRFKILQMSRTFFCEGGITAGLHFIKGEAAVIMTADLQCPPHLIPEFIKKWEAGYENIYGVVTKRHGISFTRRLNSRLFYWLINKMSANLFPPNVSDFRLVDKKVYKAINQMQERNRFMRGMFAWAGFKSIGIPHERPERFAGQSKAYFFATLGLALKGIFMYSYLPLKLSTYLGILVSISSFLFLIYTAINGFTSGTMVSIITFMFGVLFLILGIIGEYIALILDEAKQRPNFIVKRKVGFDDE